MQNKYIFTLFFLPVVVLGALMAYYIQATRFNWVEVVVSGYDPKNFFSGYYLDLQPNWQATDCRQFTDAACPTQDFLNRYKFYIRREQSAKLTQAVNAGVVKLIFAYTRGRTPYVVDLVVDDKSYIDYLANETPHNKAETALPPTEPQEGEVFH